MSNPTWGNPWEESEDTILMQMMLDGYNYVEITQALPGRTYAAVKMRSRILRLTPEQREEATRRRLARPKKFVSKPKRTFLHEPSRYGAFVIPPEVLADRNARLSTPKSLTGWVCGDPPLAFSALGRKLAEKSVVSPAQAQTHS